MSSLAIFLPLSLLQPVLFKQIFCHSLQLMSLYVRSFLLALPSRRALVFADAVRAQRANNFNADFSETSKSSRVEGLSP